MLQGKDSVTLRTLEPPGRRADLASDKFRKHKKSFAPQQLALAFGAPCVSRGRSIIANYAVAGNGDG